MVKVLLLVALCACGPVYPTLRVHDPFADSFGFACDCGSHRFQLLMRSTVRYWLRCPDCGRTWWVQRGNER